MRGTNTITINGQQYDAVTGMPLSASAEAAAASSPKQASTHASPAQRPSHSRGGVMSDVGPRPAKQAHSQPAHRPKAVSDVKKPAGAQQAQHVAHPRPAAHQMHKPVQRSQTLHRGALKRPEAQHKPVQPVRRSAMISRFAPSKHAAAVHATTAHAAARPVAPQQAQKRPVTAHKPVQQHSSANTPHHPAKPEALKGRELKDHLVKERMHGIDTAKPEKKHRSFSERVKGNRPRVATLITSMAALVLLGGYLTYLNLPSLSIRVAAARAGVEASYPSYQPAGYSFAGPVAFSPGEVRVNFASNTNDYNYTLVQRSSSWDSQAVLDNYVSEQSDQYATLQERGLTIYLMDNEAAWVNGGVLYVIDGDAPLSSEQIQKIASSTL